MKLKHLLFAGGLLGGVYYMGVVKGHPTFAAITDKLGFDSDGDFDADDVDPEGLAEIAEDTADSYADKVDVAKEAAEAMEQRAQEKMKLLDDIAEQ